ncbi:MAG: hypothetical protein CMG21_01335 [Candidatus Marinimicrobia bacterium]|nr:hypothetical protein [Candidatus Neomarinimicrobiota bacterium]|tara:strand:- start:195 stop:1823 length:1629 start_codon:yes stop_codon:yes gene_type:complete
MEQIILFIKDRFKEINPSHNIRKIHTNIRGDILSGFTVAIIALPLALAFGSMSGLGPIAGIWGAIVGGIIGGIFGGCLVGVSGPTAPKAAQIAAFMTAFVISGTDKPDLVAAFSIIFLSGLILVFISMLKISRFIHYIPYSVVAGFMCGIGVLIILNQINPFLGLEKGKNIIIENINVQALFISIPSLLILFLWSSFEKKIKILKNIPSPLIVLIIGTSIAYFMNFKIDYIGDKMISASDGKIFNFYMPDISRFSQFFVPALALAGLAVLDSLLSCIVADNMTGTRHSSDRETFGQGMANMAAGLFGGVTTATATMRTVANIKFGGKTPLASIVHGLTLLAILLGLGPLVGSIPEACLAAILFKVGIDILDYRILPVLRKIPTTDLLIFMIVLFITVYEDLMIAVALGVIFAFLKSIKQIKSNSNHKIISFSKSKFYSKDQSKKENTKVLDLEGSVFFGSIVSLMENYNDTPKHETLIIDMTNVTMIDLSGIYVLEDIIKVARDKGVTVFVSNANVHIKTVLEKVNFIKNIGEENYKDLKKW